MVKAVHFRLHRMTNGREKWINEKGGCNPVSLANTAIRFNRELTILGIGVEVVVNYSLNMKKEYPGEENRSTRLIVSPGKSKAQSSLLAFCFFYSDWSPGSAPGWSHTLKSPES